MSTAAKIQALNIEITRSKNQIRFIEERLTQQQCQAALKIEQEKKASRQLKAFTP